MRLLHLLPFLIPLSASYSTLSPHQALLNALDRPVKERVKVPGHNPAYFTRVKAEDQLFRISEFTVSPNPPLVFHRIFFYLRGTTGVTHLPGLANATLSLSAKWAMDNDVRKYAVTMNISDCRPFTVRDGEELTYGGPLVPGINEMVGDIPLLQLEPRYGSVVLDVEAVARLLDGRVLFAFEGRVEYDV